MKVFLALLLFFGTSSFAMNRVQTLIEQNPDTRPYAILQQFYDESTIPAAVTDFEFVTDTPHLQTCIFALPESDRGSLINGPIARYSVTVPAQSDNGPLFPAVPASIKKDMNCLVFGVDDESLCKNAKISTTTTDLVWKLDAGYSDTPATLYMRKNGELISTRLTFVDNNKAYTAYGYCYRHGSAP